MKHSYLLAAVLLVVASCTKPKTTINNHYIPDTNSMPAFGIDGITDMTFTNNFTVVNVLNLTVRYNDSVQENVTLSVSGLPNGVVIDTNWVHSGIPTYSTTLYLYDTAVAGGATPGTYPVTITATTPSGKQKFFTFKMKINAMSTTFLGKYNDCRKYCTPSATYTDSVYADPSVINKIWFVNYANSGQLVYAMMTGQGGGIVIPDQTIGGTTYNGTGSVSANHSINISISSSCALNMF